MIRNIIKKGKKWVVTDSTGKKVISSFNTQREAISSAMSDDNITKVQSKDAKGKTEVLWSLSVKKPKKKATPKKAVAKKAATKKKATPKKAVVKKASPKKKLIVAPVVEEPVIVPIEETPIIIIPPVEEAPVVEEPIIKVIKEEPIIKVIKEEPIIEVIKEKPTTSPKPAVAPAIIENPIIIIYPDSQSKPVIEGQAIKGTPKADADKTTLQVLPMQIDEVGALKKSKKKNHKFRNTLIMFIVFAILLIGVFYLLEWRTSWVDVIYKKLPKILQFLKQHTNMGWGF